MIASRDTADLSPETRDRADRLVSRCRLEALTDLLIISTYRDLESQDALYAQGRTAPGHIVTNARAGFSFHNWRVAFDGVALVNGKCVWQVRDNHGNVLPAWQKVVDIAISEGLEWGGNWSTFKGDDDHFQFTSGITLAQFQAGAVAP